MVDWPTYRQCLMLFEQPGAIAAVDAVAESMRTTDDIARECLQRMQLEGRICGFREGAYWANRGKSKNDQQPPRRP